MVIKYIGRTTDFSGKTLWELIGNLKNFGVGRLVKRNMFERYKEPCFIRILKVETLENEEGKDRKVRAYVEKVFRGRRYPQVVEMEGTTYKADYRLVPKSEENSLWERVASTKLTERILPDSVPFPPLLSHILEQERSSPGEALRLKLIVKQGPDNFYRICKEGEIPTEEIKKTKFPELYES
ncbi:mitochondrial ribosomal protein S34 [Rhodnius prolixus]|uniref:Putative mitochondrial ribosomal protein n=2 Tax=Rhodnius TaxID=13248 RepID=R4FKS5_RHOPR